MDIGQYFNEVEELWNQTEQRVSKWKNIDPDILKRKPSPEKWSALECIEHLNQTYKVYLPNLEESFAKAKSASAKTYKPGLFGKLMINSVSNKANGNAKMPMKTFSFFEPGPLDDLNKEEVLNQFIESHEMLNGFIQKSKKLDINNVKVQSALSWMKFRLGVCFLFLLNHELRHIAQAERALNNF